MPAAYPPELKEKVKMVTLQIGPREAARQFDIPEGTVTAWSTREGWFEQVAAATLVKEKVIEERGMQSVAVRSSVDVMLKLGEKSKLRAAKVGDNTLKAISRKRDDKLIACAPAFKATVDSLAKIHEWGSPANNLTQVNVNLTGLSFKDSPK